MATLTQVVERTNKRPRRAAPRVELAPAGPQHAGVWLAWRRQPSSVRNLPILPLTLAELRKRLDASTPDLAHGERTEQRWVILLDGKPVGTVAASHIAWRMGYAELSYMVSETYQGRGIATEAVALLVDTLFRETDLHRVYVTISAENRPSIAVARRLGFKKEGTLREHFLIKGRHVDHHIYGLLRSEWPGLPSGSRRPAFGGPHRP